MTVEDISNIHDAQRFVEGSVNDLLTGITDKDEFMIQMGKYTVRIKDMVLNERDRKGENTQQP